MSKTGLRLATLGADRPRSPNITIASKPEAEYIANQIFILFKFKLLSIL